MENNIQCLGFAQWSKCSNYKNFDSNYIVLRVTEVNKNSCIVSDGCHIIHAELSGRFVFDSENSEDFPATGDWVEAEVFDNNSFAIIHNILPRNTLLKRKKAGKTVGFQLIASNVDIGLIVQAANNINLNLFERYLVMLSSSSIESLAVITKIDLLSSSELNALEEKLSRIRCPFVLLNNADIESFGRSIEGMLVPENTYCLLGPSGVGKSTILNNLLQREVQKTSEVRQGDGKGRHTTVSRQLLRLDSGVIFIDTPGMRELANFEVGRGIENTFDEFGEYNQLCRFKDCSHTHESGCAVKVAVERGEIEPERYDNYLKIKKETEYYGMQYHDKIKKDKKLSKILKHYNKNNNKRF